MGKVEIIDPVDSVAGAVPASIVTVWPAFVLLFAVTPDAAAKRADPPAGLVPIPHEVSESYRNRLEALQQRLLGEPYLRARRLQRISVGRMTLPVLQDGAPAYADIHLVVHKSGAAVWEVWLSAAPQPMNVARWIGWLDMQDRRSLAQLIWQRLAPTGDDGSTAPEMALPMAVLRFREGSLNQLVDLHGHDLVKLLHRDALEIHAQAFSAKETLLARNTLPLLVTLELLCLERAILRSFLDRFARGVYGTVEDLIQLRRDIFDGLEEYYGTLAKTHGHTAEATALGETLFGIDDLFDSVVERLEALTFEITTRNQQAVSQLGFWLTTSFGAIETGFVASSIATWHYADNLVAVLGWTVGVTLATALVISSLLRWRLKR